MRLKNILIVVEDIELSKKFYKDLFGLVVVTDFDGNVILSEGLVLQDKKIWEKFVQRDVVYGDCASELYFVENNLDEFIEKLDNYDYPIKYVNKLITHEWGQRVIRFYDPDGHLIEVGEDMEFVERRLREND